VRVLRILGAVVLAVAVLACLGLCWDQFSFAKNADHDARFYENEMSSPRRRPERSNADYDRLIGEAQGHAEVCRSRGRFYLGAGLVSLLGCVGLIGWQCRPKPAAGVDAAPGA
jgi:hypothetical protein